VRLAPNSAATHFNLGLVLDRTGRTQEALAQMRYVLKLNPANETARSMVAEMEGRDEVRKTNAK
jgi:Flp pilus assembly protein TadD